MKLFGPPEHDLTFWGLVRGIAIAIVVAPAERLRLIERVVERLNDEIQLSRHDLGRAKARRPVGE